MIKFREQVPSVYTSASRDFQYLGWLIDIVLNSVKHNVDGLYDLPNTNADPRLAELLAMTLGFKVKRNYDKKQLAALAAALPRILKYKGTKKAVDMAGKALIAASGSTGNIVSEVNGGKLEVKLPKNLIDVSLFTDLLHYVMPAGMTCRIIRTDVIPTYNTTEVGYSDNVFAKLIPDLDWDSDKQASTGLANMFDVGSIEPSFANYLRNSLKTPNIGLLDNSIIPVVEEPLAHPLPSEWPDSPIDGLPDYSIEQNDSGTTVVINKYTTETTDSGTTVIIGED